MKSYFRSNNSLNNQKGAVLITMLMLLIVITLVGIIAINVSTVDIQIAGNLRRESTAFGGAEAGVDVAIPVIESTIENSAIPTAPSGYSFDTTSVATLESEITGGADNNSDTTSDTTPDITINNINGATVKIDVDRLYAYTLPGSNVGFASGYEGIGAGSAGGGTAILYRIDAQATR